MKNSKGSATILVLLLSAVIITIGIGFDWIVKEHMKASYDLAVKNSAMLKAYSWFNRLLYFSLIANETNAYMYTNSPIDIIPKNKIRLDGTPVYNSKKDIEISIQDTNGLISLNTPNYQAFYNLLAQNTDIEPTFFLASLGNWISINQNYTGATDSYYKNYKPRHYPMQYKKEILLVAGMNKKAYDAIKDYITILPNTGFNPNTAPLKILMARLNMSKDQAESFMAYRENNIIYSNEQLQNFTNQKLFPSILRAYFMPSNVFRIVIKAFHDKKVVYTLKIGLDKKPNYSFPFSILSWQEK